MDTALIQWGQQAGTGVIQFVHSLQLPGKTGRFLPCLRGLKPDGRNAALGFSCFALKLHHMLGLWEALDKQTQAQWLAFLQSFQVQERFWQHQVLRNAYIDPVVLACLKRKLPRHQCVLHDSLVSSATLTRAHRAIIAETKQAIATLAELNASSERPYAGFPQTPEALQTALGRLNWAQPWGAGGQAAAIAVFLKTEAPRLLPPSDAQALLDICSRQFEQLADKNTGAYFQGVQPEYGELINGAMKVLTGLDWLDIPVHYSEQLIETCLAQFPDSEGCHLVDAVYVLYRCLQYTQYRKADIQNYCLHILEMMQHHHNSDGGFSYYVGRSQKKYYDVPISEGVPVSDIHGTILLTWALVMILEILESNAKGWKVIKP